MSKRTSPRGKHKVAVAEERIKQIQNPQEEQKKKRLTLIIAGAAALAVSLAIYILRLDKVAGLIVDDAWYVLLAKSLATGQGYTLINSPTPVIPPRVGRRGIASACAISRALRRSNCPNLTLTRASTERSIAAAASWGCD